MKTRFLDTPRFQTKQSLQIWAASVQAGLLAAACSQVPLPIGVAIEMVGANPVAWTQRRMLARLGAKSESCLIRGRGKGRSAAGLIRHRLPARTVEIATRSLAQVASKAGLGQAARLLAKRAPIIGAVVVGIHACSQTAALGYAAILRTTSQLHVQARI
ncbi:MAG: hypothetical protein RJA63_1777 [Pseudomonadota bacterium]|jgi:hypothetical protein